jgi:hypothetical protein
MKLKKYINLSIFDSIMAFHSDILLCITIQVLNTNDYPTILNWALVCKKLYEMCKVKLGIKYEKEYKDGVTQSIAKIIDIVVDKETHQGKLGMLRLTIKGFDTVYANFGLYKGHIRFLNTILERYAEIWRALTLFFAF